MKTQKISNEELNNWYFEQNFDQVRKITGIDPMHYPEADDIAEEDLELVLSRNEAIDEARKVWDKMDYEAKLEFYEANT